MHLHHLPLPSLTPYTHALYLQSLLQTSHLNFLSRGHPAPPPPTLLTFQTPPTYTTGRRDLTSLSSSQIAHLTASGTASFHPSSRGGQTTFHGPGQLTAFLVCNLRTHGLTSRAYVAFLENSIIETLAQFGLQGYRTTNPGVWMNEREEKVASVGVALRRYVSTYGVGLNVSTELGWFERIVMCGLPEKRATSMEREGDMEVDLEGVGTVFADRVAAGLKGVEAVRNIEEVEIMGLEEEEGTATKE
ncbi:MAG: hypothetical protein Q9220_005164 [cf. Caloplaca sp. 1 TL-2023]